MSYRCEHCGYRTAKWMGFCPQCKTQGALSEWAANTATAPEITRLGESGDAQQAWVRTGVKEFDRALGAGVAPGSVVMIGGEPGIGKSTLLLQVAAAVSRHASAMFVSAEESVDQVKRRAGRLQLGANSLLVASETSVERIIAALEHHRPALAVIDSIQAVTTHRADGLAGGVGQVRESAARFIETARRLGTALVLVGHVTKDGALAGPKLLEHMVDVVCSLDGDAASGLRFLRALKNRHGSIDHAGIFEMTGRGMDDVPDPSRVFMGQREGFTPGTVLFPMADGRRVLLVEVQALVAASNAAMPRRSVKGVESSRVQQLLAVLAKHADVELGRHDVYVNVAGGLRIREPAVDLPIALALTSSLLDLPVPKMAAWGEVGLAGELRAVPHARRRGEEARRLGVASLLAPAEGELRSLADALFIAGLVEKKVPVRIE